MKLRRLSHRHTLYVCRGPEDMRVCLVLNARQWSAE